MMSMDSGVETGNDSNDSSVTPYDLTSAIQIKYVPYLLNTSATLNKIREQEKIDRENDTLRKSCLNEAARLARSNFSSFPSIAQKSEFSNDNNRTTDASTSSTLSPVPHCTAVVRYKEGDIGEMPKKSTSKNCFRERVPVYDSLVFVRNKIHFNPSEESDTFDPQKKLISRSIPVVSRHRKRVIKHLGVSWSRNPYQNNCNERKMRLASAMNNTELMTRLLNDGVSPNNQDEQGRTPLHLASCRGYTEMVKILLEHGANPNLRDCLGNAPLHLAVVANNVPVVSLLLKAGTDVLSCHEFGFNPVQLAQTKLRILQNYGGAEIDDMKKEAQCIVSILLMYLEKQKDAQKEEIEALSNFCSRLSVSNTADQVRDEVKDVLSSLDSLKITS